METTPTGERSTLNLFGLQLDLRLSVIVIASTLLLMLDYYHRFLPAQTAAEVVRAKAVERIVFYLVIPLLIIVLVFRDRPGYPCPVSGWPYAGHDRILCSHRARSDRGSAHRGPGSGGVGVSLQRLHSLWIASGHRTQCDRASSGTLCAGPLGQT